MVYYMNCWILVLGFFFGSIGGVLVIESVFWFWMCFEEVDVGGMLDVDYFVYG